MMIDALLPFYRLTLAWHVISVIPWMVGMLTMPRRYVECARCSGSCAAIALVPRERQTQDARGRRWF